MMDQSPLLSPVARAILAGMRQNPNYAQQVQQGLANLDSKNPAQSVPPDLADLLKKQQVIEAAQHIQNNQMRGMPQGTVAGDINNEFQRVVSGQPPMPQGAPQGPMPPQGAMPPQGPMPPQGAMPPQQPPMDPRMAAGIGTLPAPNMTQNMASGGIVAFENGGGVYGNLASAVGLEGPYRNSYIPPIIRERLGARDTEQDTPSEYETYLNRYFRQLAGAPAPDLEATRAGIDQDYEAVNKLYADRATEVARRGQEAKNLSEADLKELEKQNRFDRAAAFFEAAANPQNTTFLGGISQGLGGYARAKAGGAKEERALKRELADRQEKLADASFAVDEARARLKVDTGKEARTEYRDALKQQQAAQAQAAAVAADMEKIEATKDATTGRGAKELVEHYATRLTNEADALRTVGRFDEADQLDARAERLLNLKTGTPLKESNAILNYFKIYDDQIAAAVATMKEDPAKGRAQLTRIKNASPLFKNMSLDDFINTHASVMQSGEIDNTNNDPLGLGISSK